MNESNSMVKQDMGQMPDPLMSALNAAMTQYLGGTSYNGGPSSIAPPRTMPGGMQMQVAAPPPMPEPNPMFHPQSPLEYDMGRLFAQAMQGEAPPPMMPMTAMGEEPPPLPDKKPAEKKKLPAKPERAKGKGNPPKDEPKLKTPPPSPKKRAIASK